MSAEEAASIQPAEVTPLDADLGIMHLPQLSHVLTGELARLFRKGFWLVPLGLKRTPLVRLTDGQGNPVRRCPLSLVLSKMAGAGSSNYAIRLKGILVVDIDSDTPEAREYVLKRFGESSVQVKSPRGIHHYFRYDGEPPAKVRLPGIVIDFKSGEQQLIAGPYAERADGGQYWPLVGKLESVDLLPPFFDKQAPARRKKVAKAASLGGERIPVGGRNEALYRKAISYVSCSDTKNDLVDDLRQYRDIFFEDPQTVPDSEVEKIADWAIQKRQQGNVFSGRRSSVLIPRTSIDKLAAGGHGLAHLLYSVIMADLGHRPGYEFSIVPDALRSSGKLKAGRRQIYEAIQTLIDVGLIEVAFHSPKPKVPHRYRLAGRQERGEGFDNYIDTPTGHKGFVVYDGGRVD